MFANIQFSIQSTYGSLFHGHESWLTQNTVYDPRHMLLLLPHRWRPKGILEILTLEKLELNQNFP